MKYLLVPISIFLMGFSGPNNLKPIDSRYCKDLADLIELYGNEFLIYKSKAQTCEYNPKVCAIYHSIKRQWSHVFKETLKEIRKNCLEA